MRLEALGVGFVLGVGAVWIKPEDVLFTKAGVVLAVQTGVQVAVIYLLGYLRKNMAFREVWTPERRYHRRREVGPVIAARCPDASRPMARSASSGASSTSSSRSARQVRCSSARSTPGRSATTWNSRRATSRTRAIGSPSKRLTRERMKWQEATTSAIAAKLEIARFRRLRRE